MNTKVIELELKVSLMRNIMSNEALEDISKLIDRSLLKTQKYADFHKENKYKYYNFGSLWPLESNKIYKKGNIYSIKIRTVHEELAEHFEEYLVNEYTDSMKALTINKRYLPKKHIVKIYNITPSIAKFEDGYWRENQSLETYERRIKDNIIKKYNDFFNTKIDEDFELFNMIKFENIKPISTKYKNISLLGDKMTLYIAENEMAQEMAYFILGTGLLEMGSRGFGYCNYKWI